MYPLATQTQAVCKYGIDDQTSPSDIIGDWTKLKNYATIPAACPWPMTNIRAKETPKPSCDDTLKE